MEKVNLKFYNTLTRRKEIFKPIRKDWVGFYTCGPTVYNFAHIGNIRTYIFEDILRRTLEYAGHRVRHVMNITDVDDKIIRDAHKARKTIFEFVKPYERKFFEDLKKINIEKAWKYPKATDHIRDMIKIIQELLHKKLAYEMNGSVYFDISKFKTYGKLSRLRAQELKTSVRADLDEYGKKDIQDFVLWKKTKQGEPSWTAPFGKGRPGWHIECSAMSMKYLGHTFDIHAGGVDLIFPHHENEIAQSEGATGKKFVNFFVEGEHLLVNGEKMSKSLGNVFTLRDIEKRGFNSLGFRYLLLTAHYRSKLNFTWESLTAAQNSLERLYDFVRLLQKAKKNAEKKSLAVFEKKFTDIIFNDLDTPKALAVIWELMHAYHKKPTHYDPKTLLKIFYKFDAVLGLGLKNLKENRIPAEISKLAQKREEFRKTKNWAEADKIRRKIEEAGWMVEDNPEGSIIKRKLKKRA